MDNNVRGLVRHHDEGRVVGGAGGVGVITYAVYCVIMSGGGGWDNDVCGLLRHHDEGHVVGGGGVGICVIMACRPGGWGVAIITYEVYCISSSSASSQSSS